MPNKQWIHWVRDLKGASCSLPCCSAMCDSLRSRGLHHTRLPCPSPSPRAYLNAHPLSLWNHPTISSSVTPYSPALNLPSTRVFSSELALCIRSPKDCSFSFKISPSNGHLGLISFRVDWLDLLALQGTLKNLLHHYSSKALILQCSAFFTVQLSHPYMTTGKAIALTIWTFVDKVMSLLLICHLFIKIPSLVTTW